MMEPPCFDTKTKTDCPRRAAGCAVTCPDWAAYTKERDAEYARRALEISARAPVYGLKHDRIKEHYRKLKYRNQRGKLGIK